MQDSDRLDATQAICLTMDFAFGGSKQRKIYDVKNFEPFNIDELEL